ncbi:hypothetical protein [Streptomyces subrutilus]|uniref:hypothetical protein n=1 Tax=Streptomyces subrutilus TaxID=36818 RepID=UPI001E2DDAF4|nr:hypothetical protein [Streptomyces subrutilus]
MACTAEDMDAFGSSGRLAGVAGLAPVPRIQVASVATCVGHTATTAGSCASSTSPPISLPVSVPSRTTSTTASEPRVRATSRRFSRSPAVTSTFSGPSSATNANGQPGHRNRA